MHEKLHSVLKGIADVKSDVDDIKPNSGSLQTHLYVVEAAVGRCEYRYINLEGMACKHNFIFNGVKESERDENYVDVVRNFVTEKLRLH